MANNLCFRLFLLLQPMSPLQKCGLGVARPSIQSRETGNSHFYGYFLILKTVRAKEKFVTFTWYILNPILFSQHPCKLGRMICTHPPSTQLVSSKSGILPGVCVQKYSAPSCLPQIHRSGAGDSFLAETCALVKARPLSKLSHQVVLYQSVLLQRTVTYVFGRN